jgi:hypothetical protein
MKFWKCEEPCVCLFQGKPAARYWGESSHHYSKRPLQQAQTRELMQLVAFKFPEWETFYGA